jgi:hypothetical protein
MTTPDSTATSYVVPDDPADPEAAALDLIVRMPADLLGHDWPTREALQEFTAVLSAEGAFTGMSWHDAKAAAVAIVFDATNRDDAAEALKHRAHLTGAGVDNQQWDDRGAMVHAFITAAAVLAL